MLASPEVTMCIRDESRDEEDSLLTEPPCYIITYRFDGPIWRPQQYRYMFRSEMTISKFISRIELNGVEGVFIKLNPKKVHSNADAFFSRCTYR